MMIDDLMGHGGFDCAQNFTLYLHQLNCARTSEAIEPFIFIYNWTAILLNKIIFVWAEKIYLYWSHTKIKEEELERTTISPLWLSSLRRPYLEFKQYWEVMHLLIHFTHCEYWLLSVHVSVLNLAISLWILVSHLSI